MRYTSSTNELLFNTVDERFYLARFYLLPRELSNFYRAIIEFCWGGGKIIFPTFLSLRLLRSRLTNLRPYPVFGEEF